jgi:hypothetical protein
VLKRWQLALAAGVAEGWRDAAARCRRYRVVVQRCATRRAATCLKDTWLHWRACLQMPRRLKRLWGNAEAMWRNHTASGAWLHWREVLHSRSLVRQLLRRSLALRECRTTSSVLGAWAALAAAGVERRVLLQRAAARCSNRIVLAGWQRWCFVTDTASRRQGLLATVAKRWSCRYLAASWQRWLDATAAAAASTLRLLAATVRVDSIVVRHRLRGWCAVTARRRQHRASLLRMQLALVERLRAKREGRVMQSWGQWARWQRELTVRVERHVVRTERAFALRVLAGWVAVYHQLCEQMANLRTCISRKRVAQKWFLRWYWDAFDTDIKVALTDILETPETAEVLDTYWTSDDLRDAGSAPTPARGQRQYSAVSRMAQVSPAGPADYPVEYGVLARADSRMSNINPVFDSGGSGVTRSSGGTPHTAVERSGGARSSEGHGRRSSMELYQESVAAYEATGAGTASLSTTVLQSTERMEMRQNVSYESFEHHGFTRFD